jgi:hypothetical protein
LNDINNMELLIKETITELRKKVECQFITGNDFLNYLYDYNKRNNIKLYRSDKGGFALLVGKKNNEIIYVTGLFLQYIN